MLFTWRLCSFGNLLLPFFCGNSIPHNSYFVNRNYRKKHTNANFSVFAFFSSVRLFCLLSVFQRRFPLRNFLPRFLPLFTFPFIFLCLSFVVNSPPFVFPCLLFVVNSLSFIVPLLPAPFVCRKFLSFYFSRSPLKSFSSPLFYFSLTLRMRRFLFTVSRILCFRSLFLKPPFSSSPIFYLFMIIPKPRPLVTKIRAFVFSREVGCAFKSFLFLHSFRPPRPSICRRG